MPFIEPIVAIGLYVSVIGVLIGLFVHFRGKANKEAAHHQAIQEAKRVLQRQQEQTQNNPGEEHGTTDNPTRRRQGVEAKKRRQAVAARNSQLRERKAASLPAADVKDSEVFDYDARGKLTKAAKTRHKKLVKKQQKNYLAQQQEAKRKKQWMESKKQDERLKQRNFERSRLEIEQAAAATAKQVADDAEYQQWKRLIKTEKSGEAVDEDVTQLPDFQDVFIQYIVDNKVVVLEEVAGEFGIKTARAVAILEELVIDKKLMGVFDQRGLFLHVSSTSLDRIAAQILAQGKLTMEQLHNIVNKEVDLIP